MYLGVQRQFPLTPPDLITPTPGVGCFSDVSHTGGRVDTFIKPSFSSSLLLTLVAGVISDHVLKSTEAHCIIFHHK